MFPNTDPTDRDTPSPKPLVYLFIHSFIHVCLPESPKRSPPTYGEKPKSPSMKPHADGRHTKMGCSLVPQGDCLGVTMYTLFIYSCIKMLSIAHIYSSKQCGDL